MAAFTADYMEVINCLSVAGGLRSKPIKLPEPASSRDGEWRGLNSGPRLETPTSRGTEDVDHRKDARCDVCYSGACFTF